MELYKEKFNHIFKIIKKSENLILTLKNNNNISLEDENIFLHIKENLILNKELIFFFLNLYYINYYEYLSSLDNLIDIKTEYLKK